MGGRRQQGGNDSGVLPPPASAVCRDNNRPSEGTEVLDGGRGGAAEKELYPGRDNPSVHLRGKPARVPSVTDGCWRRQCSAGKHGGPQQGYDIYSILI